MPDLHLLLTPAFEISLENVVQLVKGEFSFRVKKELGSNLELWERGYTQRRVKDSADYERHVDYIRENPVRAALVETAGAYLFASDRRKSEIDPIPPWLKPEALSYTSPRSSVMPPPVSSRNRFH